MKINDRERFHRLMDYEPVDRCVYGVRTGAWPETRRRWMGEGYDPGCEPLYDTDHWETYNDWFYPFPPIPRKVVEEEEKTILYINDHGILVRERRDEPESSMPQFVEFPVKTRDDFRRFHDRHLNADFERRMKHRLGEGWEEQLASYRDRGVPLMIIAGRFGGFFGGPRSLVGLERLCTLFYDDPAFVEEMMDCLADYMIAILGPLLTYTGIDVFGFWEDMAYREGSLIDPGLVRRYMLPRYAKVVEYLRTHGVRWIALDSDGDITELIPAWLEAGVNIIFPFEVQSGMDVNRVRDTFGRELRMWGGVDKRALAKGQAAIDAELERVKPLIREGGYVPAPDHSLPPDVPFRNYRYYMERLHELCTAIR